MTGRARAAWIVGVLAAVLFAAPFTVKADHWWGGGFHWPELPIFDLTLGDNVSSAWTSYVDEAVADWNDVPAPFGQAINVVLGPGSTNPRQCRASADRVEVCSGAYGLNGWLGVALHQPPRDDQRSAAAEVRRIGCDIVAVGVESIRERRVWGRQVVGGHAATCRTRPRSCGSHRGSARRSPRSPSPALA
jgi:hypothetical protein